MTDRKINWGIVGVLAGAVVTLAVLALIAYFVILGVR